MNKVVKKCVENVASELFVDYNISVKEILDKDGYLGDIIFVTIHGTTEDKVEKKIEVAIKVSKSLQFDSAEDCVETAFKQEIFFYDEVFPAFERIQGNIRSKFKPYPHCFKCFPDRNVLVIENLKAKGYEMLDKDIPMDFEQCKAVMEVFGKLHALSFAMKDRDVQLFDKLSKYSRDLNRKRFESWKDGATNSYKTTMQEALHLLKEKGDVQLSVEMEKVMTKWEDKFCGYQEEDEPQAVLTHGDGWNNNMMFRYSDKEIIVKLIDWQLADVRTPVYDICLFLYSSCSDFKHFDQLIRIYHDSLAVFLEELNVNPKVFTFEDLQTHLLKYTPFLIIHLPFLLKFVFSDGTLNVDEGSAEWYVRMPLLKQDLFHDRLKRAFQYYYTTYVK
ncbi:unnamed protein product [Callosobruchus maculatus]|uniref:CHK kinase-like domain-containing protein n=1 Tax=Callosobruchus maculatus TaxID=64391 RepID=A0A653DCV5_CALMS|nr:unnamed protein product [Callosobruchus maculatus]